MVQSVLHLPMGKSTIMNATARWSFHSKMTNRIPSLGGVRRGGLAKDTWSNSISPLRVSRGKSGGLQTAREKHTKKFLPLDGKKVLMQLHLFAIITVSIRFPLAPLPFPSSCDSHGPSFFLSFFQKNRCRRRFVACVIFNPKTNNIACSLTLGGLVDP